MRSGVRPRRNVEPVFDAIAYRIAYQFALAAGIGHRESVRHATLAARAGERDPAGQCRVADRIEQRGV